MADESTNPTPVVEEPVATPTAAVAEVASKPATAEVSATYPVSLAIVFPENGSRLLALFFWIRSILLIPHFVAVIILAIVCYFVMLLNFLIILVTGKQNQGMFNLLSGYLRWSARLNAYTYGLTDIYPPFRLEE
ncbi:MAG: DUF4389 domain-containing protein [bacterium]